MSSDSVLTGRVKWFNNKSGFGFVSVVQSDKEDLVGKDIFAHHTSIVVSKEQFRYLVQGEYVNFSVSEVEGDSAHKFQTSNVTGISGGLLMCETRFESKQFEKQQEGGETTRNLKWNVSGKKGKKTSEQEEEQ
jgi:cold shock CspA family protein